MKRIFTAAVMMVVLWVVIKKTPPAAFFGLVALVIAVSAWECYRMLETRGDGPFTIVGIAASVLVAWPFLGSLPGVGAVAVLVGVTTLSVAMAMLRRPDPDAMLRASAGTLFPVLLVGLSLACTVGLRMQPGEDGTDLLLLLLMCVICSDTAAYYVGTAVGRRRMAPLLSPKKTWEGAAGGVMASVGGAIVAHLWFYQRLPLAHALVVGVMLSVGGVVGDLAESMIKRAAGVKDSSALLPGHGGLLDRVDSLLVAGPALYGYYRLFLGAVR